MLKVLTDRLALAVTQFTDSREPLGKPELVEQAATKAAQLFVSSSKARPSKDHAYAAAVEFMHGRVLSDYQLDLIAGVLCDPLPGFQGTLPVGQKPFPMTLDRYRQDAESGNLPRLTWYGLLCSYFKFNPLHAQEQERAGWEALRTFLQRTWPLIDRESDAALIPDWIKVLRSDPGLLEEEAAYRYSLGYLGGDHDAVKRLSTELAIPESSWFWRALVLSAIERVGDAPDDQFRSNVSKLLQLIRSRPAFRDEALIALLTRYQQCSEKPIHEELRDYVVDKEAWRNPKLKAAGIATTWNRVSDEVWRMVLGWVNERNLRDFFGILATRNDADEGRLAFWSNYLNQITWTRLVFGAETMELARRNRAIKELIAGEDGAYALLHRNRDLDAFVMQIGDYIIVEFSKTPNAAYIYESGKLKFDPYARTYQGNTEDLKYGFQDKAARRIVHSGPWAQDAAAMLKRLGIYRDSSPQSRSTAASPLGAAPPTSTRSGAHQSTEDDRTGSPSNPAAATPIEIQGTPGDVEAVTRSTRTFVLDAPVGAPFKMKVLRALLERFEGAYLDDKRREGGAGGRLWVENRNQHAQLDRMLKIWGFRWAESRQAFYYPEG